MSWQAVIEKIDVGFFFPRESSPRDFETEYFRYVGVAGLPHDLYFVHLRVAPTAEPATKYFVLSSSGAPLEEERWPLALAALRPLHFTANAFLLVVTGRERIVEVTFAEGSSRACAAAAASVMYSESWDERDPIPIRVGSEEIGVRIDFGDGRLSATID